MQIPVIDLHCDLLAYLDANHEHSPRDQAARCSIPQLQKGGVIVQTLALFTQTQKGAYQSFLRQFELYHRMLERFSNEIAPLTYKKIDPKKLHFVLSIENGSGLLEEDEPFYFFLKRLEMFKELPVYMSLTWNEENRFGGGSDTQIGLKREGELALEALAQKKKIAIDLSHASDKLAMQILEYIHKNTLQLIPIASHSNFRKVKHCSRNLPDAIAKEIVLMGGIIGINFVSKFVGDSKQDFLKQVRYGLEMLGDKALALGADFFWEEGLQQLAHLKPLFYEDFDGADCYVRFFKMLEKELTRGQIEKIAYKNAWNFFSIVD